VSGLASVRDDAEVRATAGNHEADIGCLTILDT